MSHLLAQMTSEQRTNLPPGTAETLVDYDRIVADYKKVCAERDRLLAESKRILEEDIETMSMALEQLPADTKVGFGYCWKSADELVEKFRNLARKHSGEQFYVITYVEKSTHSDKYATFIERLLTRKQILSECPVIDALITVRPPRISVNIGEIVLPSINVYDPLTETPLLCGVTNVTVVPEYLLEVYADLIKANLIALPSSSTQQSTQASASPAQTAAQSAEAVVIQNI